MALRTVVHYKEMEKHYQEFIDVYSEDNELNSIMAWIKEGYNYRKFLNKRLHLLFTQWLIY